MYTARTAYYLVIRYLKLFIRELLANIYRLSKLLPGGRTASFIFLKNYIRNIRLITENTASFTPEGTVGFNHKFEIQSFTLRSIIASHFIINCNTASLNGTQ
jgi:hypothetical protein